MTKSKKRLVILKSTIELKEADNLVQPSQVTEPDTTNINMIVFEKKPRKSTKKTKMITPEIAPVHIITEPVITVGEQVNTSPNFSGGRATGEVSSEEAFCPLPNSSGGHKERMPPPDLVPASRVPSCFADPLPLNKTTKKPPTNKKTQGGNLNNPVSDIKRP